MLPPIDINDIQKIEVEPTVYSVVFESNYHDLILYVDVDTCLEMVHTKFQSFLNEKYPDLARDKTRLWVAKLYDKRTFKGLIDLIPHEKPEEPQIKENVDINDIMKLIVQTRDKKLFLASKPHLSEAQIQYLDSFFKTSKNAV